MSIDFGDTLDRMQTTFPSIPWDIVVPFVLILASAIVLGIPLWKNILHPMIKFVGNVAKKRRFLRESVHNELSYMEWKDVEYALNQYIPTRYSRNGNDPGYYEEPVPEEISSEQDESKQPLLIEHFLSYEFDGRYNGKFYLCLADCGMGKTTFLINLYYRMMKEKKYPCKFVFLCEENCMEKIKAIKDRSHTILLLDALDENDQAQKNYQKFITELERETMSFYRVVITSRTNFFETASKERLSGQVRSGGTTKKIADCKKYYITPFTDSDIQKLLKIRFRFKPRKYKQAWEFIQGKKNLSVRPMLLHYIEELIEKGVAFEYDFQLYEALFQSWVEREAGSIHEDQGQQFYEECVVLAKQIYYQWMKNGLVGIQISELEGNTALQQLKNIKFKGHALLNRTNDGVYKFSHKSFWEYMLAKLAMSDISFANDLMLNNTVYSFDRASAFVEEMMEYEEKHGWNTPLAAAGAGLYTLRCKKPEDAEKLFKMALSGQLSKENSLLIKLKLGRAYWYQLKEKSAVAIMDDVQTELEKQELTKEWLILYAELGWLLSSYSKQAKINRGEHFLASIIQFCRTKQLFSYDFYRCCEAYCCCCGSLKDQHDTIRFMKDTLGQTQDEYMEYQILSACSWKLLYNEDNEQLTDLLAKQIDKYIRFMDAYNLIILYGDYGISLYEKYSYSEEFGDKQDFLTEQLGNGFDICCAIYPETAVHAVVNAYQAVLFYEAYRALNRISRWIKEEEQRKRVEEIKHFITVNRLEDEAIFFYIRLLDSVRSIERLNNDDYVKQHVKTALHLADKSVFPTYWIYWSMFSIYDDPIQEQVLLKKGYETLCQDNNVRIDSSYCSFLKVVLEWYKGNDIDKAKIAEKLYDLTPKVFGTFKWEKHLGIYKTLSDYFRKIRDPRWEESCKKILELWFTVGNIGAVYATAKEMSGNADQYLLEVISNKAEWSQKDSNELEEYIHSAKKGIENAPSELLKQKLEEHLKMRKAVWNKSQMPNSGKFATMVF